MDHPSLPGEHFSGEQTGGTNLDTVSETKREAWKRTGQPSERWTEGDSKRRWTDRPICHSGVRSKRRVWRDKTKRKTDKHRMKTAIATLGKSEAEPASESAEAGTQTGEAAERRLEMVKTHLGGRWRCGRAENQVTPAEGGWRANEGAATWRSRPGAGRSGAGARQLTPDSQAWEGRCRGRQGPSWAGT